MILPAIDSLRASWFFSQSSIGRISAKLSRTKLYSRGTVQAGLTPILAEQSASGLVSLSLLSGAHRLLSLNLDVLQSPSSQGTAALKLEVSCRADALSSWQSPEGRAWLEDAARALGAPWCTPAHVFQSTQPRSGRPELWLLVTVRGEEAEKLGCRVSAAVVRRGPEPRAAIS